MVRVHYRPPLIFTENPDPIGDTPDPTWVELGNLLKTQAIEAINQTDPRY